MHVSAFLRTEIGLSRLQALPAGDVPISSRRMTIKSRHFQGSVVSSRSTCASVDLPMAREPIAPPLAEVKLEGIEGHGHPEVDPAPEVANTMTAALVRPPLVVVRAMTAHGGEVLHEQACVDGYQDGLAEPAGEAKSLPDLVTVVQRRLLG